MLIFSFFLTITTTLNAGCIIDWQQYYNGGFDIGATYRTDKIKSSADENTVVNLLFRFDDIDVYSSSCDNKVSKIFLGDVFKITFTIKDKSMSASFSPNSIIKTITLTF